MKAVIWVAVSSTAQMADDRVSMGEQERLSRKWCAENGFDVIKVLKVEGFSRRESDIVNALEDFRQQGVTAYDDLRRLWIEQKFDVLVAYTHSRFGRSSTLYNYIVENVIVTGKARLYLMDTGWIDETNHRAITAIGGMMSSTEVDRLVRGRDVAMSAKAKRGLPTSSAVIPSHKILRDDLGKALDIVLDDSKHRLWQDAATLLLSGISWKDIEKELFDQYGHVDSNGNPYKSLRMYDWFHNPMFWGHNARQHRGGKKSDNGTKTDTWVFDENVSAPEGVEIYYNVIEPVFKDDQAERVKAELRRRRSSVRGSNRPYRSEPFSGLFICAECGYHLTFNGNKTALLYQCVTRYWKHDRNTDCTQRRTIPVWKIVQWFDNHLELMIEDGAPSLFSTDMRNETDFYNQRIQELESEIQALDTEIRNLIKKQAKLDDTSLADIYVEEIAKLHTRQKIVKNTLTETMHERPNPDIQKGQTYALKQISEMSLDDFWEMDGVKINQMLHRLLGEYKLVIENGEIIGTASPK